MYIRSILIFMFFTRSNSVYFSFSLYRVKLVSLFLWFKEYLQAKPFPLFNLKDLYGVNNLIPYFRFTGFLQGLGSLSSVMYVLFTLFGQYLHDDDLGPQGLNFYRIFSCTYEVWRAIIGCLDCPSSKKLPHPDLWNSPNFLNVHFSH